MIWLIVSSFCGIIVEVKERESKNKMNKFFIVALSISLNFFT
jgi:hypothetical protein